LANKFVQDAREIVKTGEIVKVKVLEVDVARKRISLSMRLDGTAPRRDGPRENRYESTGRQHRGGPRQMDVPAQSAMASAFAKLQSLKK
jgi:uncharacterized protein